MKQKWVQWADRPENKNKKKGPDPWSHWYEYYDPRPVPYPRRCKSTGIVFEKEDKKAELEHLRQYICKRYLRTFPAYLDSDEWETVYKRNGKWVKKPR